MINNILKTVKTNIFYQNIISLAGRGWRPFIQYLYPLFNGRGGGFVRKTNQSRECIKILQQSSIFKKIFLTTAGSHEQICRQTHQ